MKARRYSQRGDRRHPLLRLQALNTGPRAPSAAAGDEGDPQLSQGAGKQIATGYLQCLHPLSVRSVCFLLWLPCSSYTMGAWLSRAVFALLYACSPQLKSILSPSLRRGISFSFIIGDEDVHADGSLGKTMAVLNRAWGPWSP